MLSGLVIGRIIKAGHQTGVQHGHSVILGQKAPVQTGGMKSMSANYFARLERASNHGKLLPVVNADFPKSPGPIETAVEEDGTYALPFRWGPEPSVAYDSVTVDLKAYRSPKDNYVNRQRKLRGTLDESFGTAQWKTAYLLDLDGTGYPVVHGHPEFGAYHMQFFKAIYDLYTNSRAPEWNNDRLRYSNMLCAIANIYISQGGVSS